MNVLNDLSYCCLIKIYKKYLLKPVPLLKSVDLKFHRNACWVITRKIYDLCSTVSNKRLLLKAEVSFSDNLLSAVSVRVSARKLFTFFDIFSRTIWLISTNLDTEHSKAKL